VGEGGRGEEEDEKENGILEHLFGTVWGCWRSWPLWIMLIGMLGKIEEFRAGLGEFGNSAGTFLLNEHGYTHAEW